MIRSITNDGGEDLRRLIALITVCILLSGVLVLPASAESAASKVDIRATITSEGDALVTMTVTLRLEAARTGLTFPLPLEAKSITLNGANVSTTKNSAATLVDISRISDGMVGEYSLLFDFVIPEAVKVDRDAMKAKSELPLKLTLPLLNGFEYPVENLSFVITLPGNLVIEDPKFTSIYRQDSIGSDLILQPISGSQIIGASKTILNDHEGITMTMMVKESMFPTVSTYIREGNPELPFIVLFAILAFVYWILFLRTLPLIRSRSSTAPEGITAGELGCRLVLSGGDLTMMVFSWAQLGYVLIHMDENGRVTLHKRMDMGNERNQFENRIFRNLFGNRQMVDATSMTYAKLCRKVQGIIPSERNMFKSYSGSVRLFRGLACISQIFCGVCVALNMNMALAFQIIVAIVLGVFAMVSAWLIHDIAYRNHLRGKTSVYIGLVCILIWIILGIICKQVWIPLGCVVGQFLIGYFAAYGGRRSDLGRHDAAQVLGLRSYLKHLKNSDINRLMQNDPDYFFNMAPYALAMGIIKPYARSFGRRMLPECPYIISGVNGKRTAEEWSNVMADVADLMDLQARQLQVERWITPPNIQISLNFGSKPKKAAPRKKAATRKAPPRQAAKKPTPKKRPPQN